MQEAIERSLAYKAAGADCIYPILISSYEDIAALVTAKKIPVNVIQQKPIADLRRLENIGVARVSVRPSRMKHALTKNATGSRRTATLRYHRHFRPGILIPGIHEPIGSTPQNEAF